MRTFKQRAAGTFSPTIVPGTSHCGIDDNRGKFRYDIEIIYRGGAEILDAQGFLLDNLTFQHYFDSLSDVTISCEQLAMQACAHFETLFAGRIRNVKSITVKLYPFGEVYVEANSDLSDVATVEGDYVDMR